MEKKIRNLIKNKFKQPNIDKKPIKSDILKEEIKKTIKNKDQKDISFLDII